jgi:hypothetical protein
MLIGLFLSPSLSTPGTLDTAPPAEALVVLDWNSSKLTSTSPTPSHQPTEVPQLSHPPPSLLLHLLHILHVLQPQSCNPILPFASRPRPRSGSRFSFLHPPLPPSRLRLRPSPVILIRPPSLAKSQRSEPPNSTRESASSSFSQPPVALLTRKAFPIQRLHTHPSRNRSSRPFSASHRNWPFTNIPLHWVAGRS